MTGATLNKSNLKNYYVVSEPGTHIVKSANSVNPDFVYDEGSKARYIVNLRVATIDGFQECLEIMGNKNIIQFKEVRSCFLSGAIWANDVECISHLPTKGENIIATFDYVDEVLMCTAITLIPREKLDRFDLNALDESRQLYKELYKRE
jgi:hypothetical protein